MFRAAGRLLFDLRIQGLGNLPRQRDGRPAGGWICCGIPHRTWIEPFAVYAFLPARPRLVMLADGPVMFRSWWRRWLIGRVGGVVPIWRGSGAAGFRAHSAAAAQAIAAGSVFSLFPETGPASRPPAPRRLSPGIAYFALRTGAPIVPVVFGGTHELFLRRRIEMRILEPLDVRGLAGLDAGEPLPAAGSAAERIAADHVLDSLRSIVEPVAEAAHAAAEPAPGSPRRLRWLSGPYPRAG